MMAGDADTGVCLMQMDVGLDTGAVLDRQAIPVLDAETGPELEARLADLGARRLAALLPAFLRGELAATPQDDRDATYAHKLTRADAAIDWQAGAEAIARRIRALAGRMSVEVRLGGARLQLLQATATPGASSSAPAGTIVGVKPTIDVACPDGILHIHRLRFTDRGKGTALTASEAANGFATIIHPGARFDAEG
jgi:methionyl-tRNA formyltransferase